MLRAPLLAFLSFLLIATQAFSQSNQVTQLKSIKSHNSAVTSLAVSPSSRMVVTGGADGEVKVWEIPSGKEVKALNAGEPVNAVAFSANGKYFAAGTDKGKTLVWEEASFDPINVAEVESGSISDLTFSADGNMLMNCSDDNEIKIWDVPGRKIIRTLRQDNLGAESVAFDSNGDFVASGGNRLLIWSIAGSNIAKSLPVANVSAVAFSPDGRYIAAATGDNTTKIFDSNTGSEIKSLSGHKGKIHSIAYTPDGTYLATSSSDNSVKIWNVSSGKLNQTLSGAGTNLSDVAISPDGAFLLCGNGGGELRIYSLENLTGKSAIAYAEEEREMSLVESTMPPILSIQDISFSTKLLPAGETAQLMITVKNNGPGDAQEVYAEIATNQPELSFPSKVLFPTIESNGGVETVTIYIYGEMNMPSGEAYLDIRVIDPVFKVNIQGRRVNFKTREFPKPKLVLSKYAIMEYQSGQPNNQIDVNEIIDVKFAVQNLGEGTAHEVAISIDNSQGGVLFLGAVEHDKIVGASSVIPRIDGGKYVMINYRFFINSEFQDSAMVFTVSADEKHGRFGFVQEISVPINTDLRADGYVLVARDDVEDQTIRIEDIPEFVSDVQKNIPATQTRNPEAIAIVIGNRDYRSQAVESSEFAVNDARMVSQYLQKSYGFLSENIILIQNATTEDFTSVFGTESNFRSNLYNLVDEEPVDIFVYFSGHGSYDPSTDSYYLLPIDAEVTSPERNGFPIRTLYDNLSRINYKSLTVIIEASFENLTGRRGQQQGSASMEGGITYPLFVIQNNIMMHAASSSQIASEYPEKKHSLFTYSLLKAWQGSADYNRDGKLTLGEVKSYLTESVPVLSRQLFGRDQTPQITGDENKVLIEY